jgi:hypothetical protein
MSRKIFVSWISSANDVFQAKNFILTEEIHVKKGIWLEAYYLKNVDVSGTAPDFIPSQPHALIRLTPNHTNGHKSNLINEQNYHYSAYPIPLGDTGYVYKEFFQPLLIKEFKMDYLKGFEIQIRQYDDSAALVATSGTPGAYGLWLTYE